MRFFNFILNILFPPRCASCKIEGDFLCNECIARLKIKKIKDLGRFKQNEFQYLDGVIYGLDYAENPQIKAALKQFKYRFTKDLVDYFSDLIACKLNELSMTKNKQIILVPVPLHKKRLNYRGFNQAELIARSVQEKMGDRVQVLNLLERVRHTDQQAKLNKKERQENLKDAFVIESGLQLESGLDTVYFVVDDVCTTGSTLENCAQVLKKSGLQRVYGLVVAKALKN
ncbi:hypothetical protein KJ742_07910 [Patescibacteria group bacterium]|nr:hypothetical protein [Patescibacteria group bacterium]MBU1683836.1 hypothetical protein [Patescibacteria group bacterium]MBU1934966.1 hypothetical protein [Patescibacteria group bacterium]